MTLEFADVVPHAAHAELTEVREILSDLRGVQMELLGKRLGRDGLDPCVVELIQATQVHRQPVGREFGDLLQIGSRPGGPGRGFVRGVHKPDRL